MPLRTIRWNPWGREAGKGACAERKAQRVTRFIEALKHTKGEFHGKPFELLPWQEKVIRDVFGTVRDDDPSMRQYNTAYIELPKK